MLPCRLLRAFMLGFLWSPVGTRTLLDGWMDGWVAAAGYYGCHWSWTTTDRGCHYAYVCHWLSFLLLILLVPGTYVLHRKAREPAVPRREQAADRERHHRVPRPGERHQELKHEVFLETVPGKISGIVPEAAPGITSGTYSRNNTRKSIGNSRDVNRRKHDT